MQQMYLPFTNKVVNGDTGADLEDMSDTHFAEVQCFPLESLLLAANISTVDYFSLDVEGLELKVLMTIPFHRFDIKVSMVWFAQNIDSIAPKNPNLIFVSCRG